MYTYKHKLACVFYLYTLQVKMYILVEEIFFFY